MRLFTAVCFDDEVKMEIGIVQERLKGFAYRGNFTLYENLHLTLVFIGETAGSQIPLIYSAMDDVTLPPFEISMGGVGCFERRGAGDIWWLGVDENKFLNALYAELFDNLQANGFKPESRKYKPHLTLAREVELDRRQFKASGIFMTENRIKTEVNKISLMKSERVNGVLTYTEIYEKYL